MIDPLATVEFIVRSPVRVRILECLLERGRQTRRELQAELDVVRTTVQRNLDSLEERELILAVDDGYEISLGGEMVSNELHTLTETVAFVAEAGPVLGQLAAKLPEFDPDPQWLTDATVVEATTANPYAPVEKHAETMAEAEHARLVLPATGANPLETARERVVEEAYHEAIVTPDVAETLREEPEFSETFEAMVEAGSVAVHRYDGEIPCYLGVLDDVVQFGVQDETGIPRALLETTHPEVLEWAIERFESYRDAAERLV